MFGDIGTSPLYAVKETFSPEHGIALTAANILGGLSTMFWALMIVVSLKYVMLIMRADNRGEGGIMALIALASQGDRATSRAGARRCSLIGVFGASLFYGDAVLTPAISVLSAVEGLEVGTRAFKPYVVPIAVGVLIALFALQARGTAAVGTLFGPVTLLWFLAHRRRRHLRHRAQAGGPRGAQSAARASLPHRARRWRRSSCSARWCWR